MKFLVVLLCVFAAANAVSFFDLVREEWKAFKVCLIFVYSFKIYIFVLF